MGQSAREHNQEAEMVWRAFHAGAPIRPPVVLGTNTQFFIFNHHLNPSEKVSFQDYTTDGHVMLDFQLQAAVWRAESIAPYCDDPIGIPDNAQSWRVRVDMQNFDEAAYFGAPVIFLPGQIPDTKPILTDERKCLLFDQGLPDPLRGGWYRVAHEILDVWVERLAKEPEYRGWPVKIDPFGWWTTGPLTVAMALRGQALLTDFYEDPDYVHQLLDYIASGTIARAQAHLRYFNMPVPASDMFFADDALQLISVEMAREFLLPVYKKLKAGLTTAETIKIHLCGDATRHFLWLRDDLGVNDFETGFPIDFGAVRRQLGENVTIHGGPTVMILKDGSSYQVRVETERILASGICKGGRFVLREANNLAPHTPAANLQAMYDVARAWRYG